MRFNRDKKYYSMKYNYGEHFEKYSNNLTHMILRIVTSQHDSFVFVSGEELCVLQPVVDSKFQKHAHNYE